MTNDTVVWISLFDNYFGKKIEKTRIIDWKKEFKREFYNANQSHIHFYHGPNSKFVPPLICYTNPLEVPITTMCIYQNTIITLGIRRLAASSLSTSKKLWSTPVSNADEPTNRILVDESTIYVQFTFRGIEAFELSSGLCLWTFKDTSFLPGMVLQDEKLVFLSEGSIIALDKKTGSTLFKIVGNDSGTSSLILVDDRYYCLQDNINQLDVGSIQTRSLLFSVDLNNMLEESLIDVISCCVSGSLIFFNTWNKICAIRLDMENHSASKVWSNSAQSPSESFAGLLCHLGIVWTMQTSPNGICFVGFDTTTGKKHFEVLVGESCNENHAVVYILDNDLYYGFVDAAITVLHFGAIDVTCGRCKWKESIRSGTSLFQFPVWHPKIKSVFARQGFSLIFLCHQ